ncbi:LOW QUALITY PROTEIN: hypothetical protein HID58_049579 [Brassica napus]|uniref:Uncharacterized protein n=1 Tax=Brassica napus TaxID=3708 RepID=A0ABQ8B5D3_BRANA|nr:LOW QUALITY PROTEIN: hypothetical protein HID58_049579 [Brassica napus]
MVLFDQETNNKLQSEAPMVKLINQSLLFCWCFHEKRLAPQNITLDFISESLTRDSTNQLLGLSSNSSNQLEKCPSATTVGGRKLHLLSFHSTFHDVQAYVMVCSLSMIYVSVSVKTFCQTLIPVKQSSPDAGCNDVIAEYRIDQVNQCSNFTIVFLITVIFRAEFNFSN